MISNIGGLVISLGGDMLGFSRLNQLILEHIESA